MAYFHICPPIFFIVFLLSPIEIFCFLFLRYSMVPFSFPVSFRHLLFLPSFFTPSFFFFLLPFPPAARRLFFSDIGCYSEMNCPPTHTTYYFSCFQKDINREEYIFFVIPRLHACRSPLCRFSGIIALHRRALVTLRGTLFFSDASPFFAAACCCHAIAAVFTREELSFSPMPLFRCH